MPTECVVVLDNVTTVRRSLLTDHVATLEAARMIEVCSALGHAIAC